MHTFNKALFVFILIMIVTVMSYGVWTAERFVRWKFGCGGQVEQTTEQAIADLDSRLTAIELVLGEVQ